MERTPRAGSSPEKVPTLRFLFAMLGLSAFAFGCSAPKGDTVGSSAEAFSSVTYYTCEPKNTCSTDAGVTQAVCATSPGCTWSTCEPQPAELCAAMLTVATCETQGCIWANGTCETAASCPDGEVSEATCSAVPGCNYIGFCVQATPCASGDQSTSEACTSNPECNAVEHVVISGSCPGCPISGQ